MQFLGAYSSKLGEMMEDLTTTTMAIKESAERLNLSEPKWRKLDKTRN
jgi:hypothetical protein